MTDNKLRCALIYRLDVEGGNTVCVAKYDYAGQYETHGGAQSSLYGGKDNAYSDAVSQVISNDRPSGISQPDALGGFKFVQSDEHQVVYGADGGGLCCAVVTGKNYPSRVAIAMLQEMYDKFNEKYGDAAKTAAENSLSKKAKSIMKESCEKYSDPSSVDKTQKVLQQVEAVKGEMQDNIASLLKNTEMAEDMAVKSDQLNEQASVFKKRSTDLKKQMQWKNLKMTIILSCVVVAIILAITLPLVLKGKELIGGK